ncbi:MAG: hypothetical protein IJ343_07950 [Clostridia bacterium]|nr:hypothetical protein [Clostridia bacterium]
MNGKRIAAVCGLVAICASVLCMVLGGAMPQYGDALLTVSGVCFLLAATTLGVLVMRRRAEQNAAADAAGDEEKPE